VGVRDIKRGVPGGAGSSDIGNVSKVVPTMYTELAVQTKENCYAHNEAFLNYVNSKQSNELVNKAVKAMVNSSLEIYGNQTIFENIQKEFRELNCKL
jgi:hypothetical protein